MTLCTLPSETNPVQSVEPVDDPFVGWDYVLRNDPRTRQHLSREIRAGRFPEPVQLGPKTVAWRLSTLREHYDNLPRGLLDMRPSDEAMEKARAARRAKSITRQARGGRRSE